MLDRGHKTRHRENVNYKLEGVGPGSWKLESENSDSENSYVVII